MRVSASCCCSLDDATYATLSSLMLFNNVDVVLGLYQDIAFLPRVRSCGGRGCSDLWCCVVLTEELPLGATDCGP